MTSDSLTFYHWPKGSQNELIGAVLDAHSRLKHIDMIVTEAVSELWHHPRQFSLLTSVKIYVDLEAMTDPAFGLGLLKMAPSLRTLYIFRPIFAH